MTTVSGPEREWRSIVELARTRASEGTERGYTFLDDQGDVISELSYSELDFHARIIASALQRRGLFGERALLLFSTERDFLQGFFGCLYAGVIAVPSWAPIGSRSRTRVRVIAGDAQCATVLSTESTRLRVEKQIGLPDSLARGVDWLAIDRLESHQSSSWSPPKIDHETLAFLQYTSGATSDPKGVMVTHGNLLANEEMIKTAFEHTRDSTFVGWLPLFHDMGLIGNVLQPLYIDARCILMSPMTFLQRPVRWLEAISRFRGRTSGAPNFAFDLCVDKIDPAEIEGRLDLSCWSLAFNGSEPVRAETMDRFAAAFGGCEFRRTAFFPCYGLAEATLFASGSKRISVRKRAGDPSLAPSKSDASHWTARKCDVGSGRIAPMEQVVVVEPHTGQVCPSGEVGEIWLAGPHIAQGYWQKPQATTQTFEAELASTAPAPGRFLRTGDLGYLDDGELFVCGRLKDLIVIRGQNYYPSDIELSVDRCHESLVTHAAAAFAIERDGQERLVVVQEIKRQHRADDLSEVIQSIRQAIAEDQEIQADAVVLVKPGSIPKTSSGKIQRGQCRRLFELGQLAEVARSVVADDDTGSRGPAETTIGTIERESSLADVLACVCGQVAAVLRTRIDQVPAQIPLTRLGLDSLRAVELKHRIETDLGADVELASLLGGRSVAQLAEALLARLSCKRSSAPSQPESGAARGDAFFPASSGQQGIWVECQRDEAACRYNVFLALRAASPLNADKLDRALSRLAAMHPTLGATFFTVDGRIVIRTGIVRLAIERHDASHSTENELARQVTDLVHAPFNLSHGPLFRLHWLQRHLDRDVLVLVAHHIIMDLWSLQVVLDDFSRLYTANEDCPDGDLPAGNDPYHAFVAWEESQLAGPAGRRLAAYWQTRLAGRASGRPLLECFGTTANGTARRNGWIHFSIETELTQRLRAVASAEGTTLFVVLLAALKLLLSRYQHCEDLSVGVPFANRDRPEFAKTVGCLMNLVVLRSELPKPLRFAELVDRVHQSVLGALDHQAYPFAKAADLLRHSGSARGVNPEIVFAFESVPSVPQLAPFLMGVAGGRVLLNGMEFESMALTPFPSPFDLELTMVEGPERLLGAWKFDASKYDATLLRALGDEFTRLLDCLGKQSKQGISPIAVPPTPAVACNSDADGTGRPGRTDDEASLPARYERQTASRPDAVAVVDGCDQITYRELHRRANGVCRALAAAGVGDETPVAIYLDRRLNWITAVLGILKSGATYVPLDVGLPKDRRDHVCRTSEVRAVVTDRSRRDEILPGHPQRIVLDDIQPADGAAGPMHSAGLAYVLYTSGSTGQPKGVAVSHGNVDGLLRASHEHFAFSPDDVWSQFHSYAFDLSVWEMLGALLHGGRLVIVPFLTVRSPDALVDLLRDHQVTILTQTPSAWRHLIAARSDLLDGLAHSSLRAVVFAGEKLNPVDVAPWLTDGGRSGPAIINMYGITETTIHNTYRRLTRADLEQEASPIGRSLAGWSDYLLDRRIRPVAGDVPGEIHVGGIGLGRGYFRRPDLTADRFLPNPFKAPGSRMYRSGDLARRSNGELHYIGRRDKQIKIRGNRVELGDIEAALTRHPRIHQCCVVNQTNAAGDVSLAAYLVHSDDSLTAAGLRRFLGDRLPEYMVPAEYVAIESLPLTPNGKVDRAALPFARASKLTPELRSREPESEREVVLARIWSEVLGCGRVGVDDNFFELGGDSIRSIQVQVRAKAAGIALSVPQILQFPTVRQLAAQGETAGTVGTTGSEPFSLVSDRDRALLGEGLEDAYPLTALQRGLVYHAERDPNYEIYVTSYRLRGNFCFSSLQRALGHVASRHAMLRTTFEMSRFSEALQLVHDKVDPEIRLCDLRSLAAAEQADQVESWYHRETASRFTWDRAPLWRLTVHLFRDDEFQISLSEPLLDGWSVHLFFQELLESYRLIASGQPPEWPRLAITYRSYVAEELAAQRNQLARAFWAEEIRNLPANPVATSPLEQGCRRETVREEVAVSGEVADRLGALARSLSVPLKSVLLAAHLRVVSLISGQVDVVTGLLAHGRLEAVDGDRLIGLFLNALPIRIRLGPMTWKELVLRAYQAEVRVLPFRRFPLASMPWSSSGQGAQLSTVFNFTHFHSVRDIRGSSLEIIDISASDQTYFPLTAQFNVDALSGRLRLFLDYNVPGFDRPQIKRISRYYRAALEEMARSPSRPCHESWLLPACELHQQVIEWNDSGSLPNDESSLPALFERQVQSSPDSVALASGGESVSYGELKRRVDGLARRLRAQGVGPEDVVGVCLERTPMMVVALLSVLKAGGAYLPLDPEYPARHLAALLESAKPKLVITTRKSADKFADASRDSSTAPPHCWLEDEVGRDSVCDPPLERAPLVGDHLAYLISTSGSTGRPKCVAISHHSAARFVQWATTAYSAEELSGVLASTSVCFDLSIFEIFAPLASGGTVILCDRVLDLHDLENAGRITLVNTVPSAIAELIRQSKLPESVQVVNLAGEPLRPELVNRIYAGSRVRHVFDLYGPSEDTTYSTWTRRNPGEVETIGRPLPGKQAYVLTRAGSPLPAGTEGQLFLSGVGLARGYVRHPGQTAERFCPSALARSPGARQYATGDRARFLPDGRLSFLGRCDGQVKIRGYRIELGGVEAVLLQHPTVKEAVVVAGNRNDGDKELVAYLTLRSPKSVLADVNGALRSFLKDRLPRYMIPRRFVVVEQLPRTPNGKIDRTHLPAQEPLPGPVTIRSFDLTEREEFLAALLSSELRVDCFERRDNLFDLGMDSLLAMKIIHRMREAFGRELPIGIVFDNPSIGGLARAIDEQCGAGEPTPIPSLAKESPSPFAGMLSVQQESLWILSQILPDSPFYNVPAALRIRGRASEPTLRQVLGEIVRRHEILRTNVVIENDLPGLSVFADPAPDVAIVDLSGLPASRRARVARRVAVEESRQTFNVAADKPFRVKLMQLSADEHLLAATMPHLVADEWSVNVFVHEMSELYSAYDAGRSSPLPALPIQYQDFVIHEREMLQGSRGRAIRDYWRRQLQDAPDLVTLPCDFPRPRIPARMGDRIYFDVPPRLARQAREFARAEGLSLFMVMLAAFKTFLHQSTRETDIVVGTPFANREADRTQQLVGFFVETLILRSDLSGNPTFRELAFSVRNTALAAYEHHCPIDVIISHLRPKRASNRSPFFQVVFGMWNAPWRQFRVPGLNLQFERIHTNSAKYDTEWQLLDQGTALEGFVEYDKSLYRDASVKDFVDMFLAIASDLVRNPTALVGGLQQAPRIASWPKERI